MCQGAVGIISKALHAVDNAESILKTKNLIALFMQTMNVSSITICPSYPTPRPSILTRGTDVELFGQGV
jgi:hypothetical protein